MNHETGSRTDAGINVLVVADPGLPSRRVASIRDEFEQNLQTAFAPPVALHTATETIRLRPDNTLDISTMLDLRESYEAIDVVLLLTEIPRHTSGQPLIAEVFAEENIAVVSCPTLGAWATKRRILRTFMNVIAQLDPTSQGPGPSRYAVRWAQWQDAADSSGSAGRGHRLLQARSFTGGPRLLWGMVVANDPWRTAPKLSGMMAAASATGAFGIFYNSIWQMSHDISTLRLLFIGVLAITSMVAWLIISNGLWDKPRREHLGTVVLFYNLSTVLTLLLCVLALYLTLAVLILCGGLIVISPGFMSEILGEEAHFTNYLDIAWMSAAMGVVAGALGSNFDSGTQVRHLTHGQRERQRMYTEEPQSERARASESQTTGSDPEAGARAGSDEAAGEPGDPARDGKPGAGSRTSGDEGTVAHEEGAGGRDQDAGPEEREDPNEADSLGDAPTWAGGRPSGGAGRTR